MTHQSKTQNDNDETASVPNNPTPEELKSSLEDAEFPAAAQMAKEALGEEPESQN